MSRLRPMLMTKLLVIRSTATHSQQQIRLCTPIPAGVHPNMIAVIYRVLVPLLTLREILATETNRNDISLTTFRAACRRLSGTNESKIAFAPGHQFSLAAAMEFLED